MTVLDCNLYIQKQRSLIPAPLDSGLVGEDQTLTAMSIETYLEEAGFAVQTVASMAEFGWRPIQPGLGSLERVSPHVLRHAFATHMHSGGTDLRALQELLGHAGIETTQIYTHLDTSRLHHMVRDLHPLNAQESSDR